MYTDWWWMADERRRCFIEVSGIEEDRSQVPKRHNPQFHNCWQRHHSSYSFLVPLHALQASSHTGKDCPGSEGNNKSQRCFHLGWACSQHNWRIPWQDAVSPCSLNWDSKTLSPSSSGNAHLYIYMNENIFLVEILQAWTIWYSPFRLVDIVLVILYGGVTGWKALPLWWYLARWIQCEERGYCGIPTLCHGQDDILVGHWCRGFSAGKMVRWEWHFLPWKPI